MQAVKQCGSALEYVKEQTLEICLEAIKQSDVALKYMDPMIFNLIIQSIKKPKQNIVFEDITANTYNYVENADNIINAFAKYIESIHGADYSKNILNANANPSMVDDKYIGFYIKKQNDYIYELHNREPQEKNYIDVISDTLVGKFIVTK